MTTIIVFVSSLLVSAMLVLIKAIELKFGKKNFLLELVCKLDYKAVNLINTVKFRNLQLIQTIRYIILIQSKEWFRTIWHRLQERMALEYQLRQEIMMGKRNISSRGSVSFYLKKIGEEKGAKGVIEDHLDIAQ
jgi:hypothetical protein